MDKDNPIVVGLVGIAGSGKTSTANAIAPTGNLQDGPIDEFSIIWDHLYFALPLYRMANAKQMIEGDNVRDRVAYEIHATLVDAFGNNPLYGAPSYDRLVHMVNEIADIPVPESGKPRHFLQYVGTDICRAYDPNVWVKWMQRTIRSRYLEHLKEYQSEELDATVPYCGIVVSDCRFRNEVQLIKDQPNGILIKLDISPERAIERQMKRDGGMSISAEQTLHSSEQDIKSIPDETFDAIIKVDYLDFKSQVQEVKDVIDTKLGVRLANA